MISDCCGFGITAMFNSVFQRGPPTTPLLKRKSSCYNLKGIYQHHALARMLESLTYAVSIIAMDDQNCEMRRVMDGEIDYYRTESTARLFVAY
jgi:hypothetical protein